MPFDCSAAEQKANLGTNAKNLLGFWASENYWFTQAWRGSVKLTYGKGGLFKAFWAFHCSLWDLDSQVLSSAGFLSEGLRRSSQTWKLEIMDTEWLTRDQIQKNMQQYDIELLWEKGPWMYLGWLFLLFCREMGAVFRGTFSDGLRKTFTPSCKKDPQYQVLTLEAVRMVFLFKVYSQHCHLTNLEVPAWKALPGVSRHCIISALLQLPCQWWIQFNYKSRISVISLSMASIGED